MGRLAESWKVRAGVIAAIHVAAFAILAMTEYGWLGPSLFLLFWAFLNLAFLVALRRPGISAALSLGLIAILVVLSQFKFTILWMVINFFDVLIVDSDTVAFLLSIFPDLRTTLVIAALLAIPVWSLIWRIDPFRVSRQVALLGAVACGIAVTGLSLAVPEEPWEQFQGINHISTFVRSGVTTGYELTTKGWIDFDSTTSDQLRAAVGEPCHLSGKPPNIIMVLDEASFDVTAARHQGAAGLPRPFPVVRRQNALALRRRARAVRPGTPNTTC